MVGVKTLGAYVGLAVAILSSAGIGLTGVIPSTARSEQVGATMSNTGICPTVVITSNANVGLKG